jgi:hypothetical protein
MKSGKVASTTESKGEPKERRKVPLWAERIKKMDPDIPEEERSLIYEELPLYDETGDELIKKLNSLGYKEWVTFPNNDYPDPLPKRLLEKRKAQRKYEIFCGGFLYFYDEELGKYPEKIAEEYPKKFPGDQFECQKKLEAFFGKLEVNKKHKIFFDWGKKSVTIYIKPEPGNPDPPSPPAPPPPESTA